MLGHWIRALLGGCSYSGVRSSRTDMDLSDSECLARVSSARHGVLATTHPIRGVDAIPVVYAMHRGSIVLPIDRVKAKRTLVLQRVVNVMRDARCMLLVEGWNEDWTCLWWVQVHGKAALLDPVILEEAREALRQRYPSYGAPEAVAGGLALWPERLRGWAAGGHETSADHRPARSHLPVETVQSPRKVLPQRARLSP